MSAVRTPKTLEAATALLEQHAGLAARIARLEAQRQASVAQANVLADNEVTPLLEEQDKLVAALEPWWATAAAELTKGKRKSIELGGCRVGTKAGRESLAGCEDEAAALAALVANRLANQTTVVRRMLDKGAISALIKRDGAAGKKLGELGFAIVAGTETFFVTRVDSAEAKVSA